MDAESKFCRICLKSNSNDEFINIFNNDSDIPTNIFLITSVKINQHYNSNDFICYQCVDQLNIAIEFRTNCLEAENYFQDSEIDKSYELSTIKIEILPKKQNKTKRKGNARKKTSCDTFDCLKCEKNFSCRYYLQKHEYARHTDISPEKYFSCDSCEYQSKTKSLMRSHQVNNHSLSNFKPLITYQCKFCGQICKSTGALYSHERTHRNLSIDEYLKCEYCLKAFKEKRLLKNHIQLVHEKSRMKQCIECSFIATCSGSLNKHFKAIHLKLRNHVCHECNLKFATNQQLLRHSRSHSGEKPFKCLNTACDKFFADSHGRKRHLKICPHSI